MVFGFLRSKNKENTTSTMSFSRLRKGLKRFSTQFKESLSQLILGKKTIDSGLFEELESILLIADIGAESTQQVLSELTTRTRRQELSDPQALIAALKTQLLNILLPCQKPLDISVSKKPFVLLVVGINGSGKTTTIAKLAHYYQLQNKKILLAAGDTFRAAAIEQLKIWGDRNRIPVISQHAGADGASVIYDGVQAAMAREYDLLIADTAGRLHTQNHLMAELEKIKRVIRKLNSEAPQEILLVIDGTTGQNALNQAQQFNEEIGITGIVITKLDGTAKGGAIFSIAKKMHLPIRFISVGEQMDDLRPFDAKEFIDAIFD